jgi:hypothetical protein
VEEELRKRNADPMLERSMQIRRDVDKTLYVNQHLHKDLKKEKILQSTLLKYFEIYIQE